MAIEYTNNHRRNLILYWRQFYPTWEIPSGYHVHHIKPKCTFEDKNDLRIHHPSNLIALYPDDHISIHKCRGDSWNESFMMNILGRVVSVETRAKMSKTRTGVPRPPHVAEKLRQANLGKKLTAETKKKLRDANLGKINGPRSPELIAKVTTAVKKAMARPEVKQRQRDAQLGKKASQETRQKMSASRIGTKLFNNGVLNKLFRPGTELDGFVLGKVK